MVLKLVSAAVLAVVAGLGVANAQSANDFGGPRELPPASFTGQQYVDSRGCVFLRAGLGGRTNWVPRVTASRAPLCGYPPTFGNNQVVIVEPPRAAPAPAAPEPVPAGRRPMDTVASITTPPRIRATQPPRTVAPSSYVPPAVVMAPAVRAPVPVAPGAPPQPAASAAKPVAPPPQTAERVGTTAGGGKIGCYKNAPVAERFRLQNGGSIVLCTRGDGDLTHARAPRLLEGAAAVAPSGYVVGPDPAAGVGMREQGRVALSSQDRPAVPKGFKPAFDDDRLNPDRAKGTREGWAQQDQIWTREVPARLIADVEKEKGKRVVVRKVYTSSKSEAAAPQRAASGAYVQVGTFGQASNADGASSRLARLGLPVARAKTTKNGKALQIVMAGPFGSSGEAQAALSAARRAGFADAFIR
ncbi:SPOR domain-containing protein [Pseudotabrizicola algicola]|uniref:SPOR domain-containing protein n=1 Tax=Pseudotabrizicola algicola TaxID=2709381 RepID=A0A6B3RLW1_9RHOB|nr:SPOR domain-containing protein [Pseudotabrizicola algicola]NEX47074.1 SPOR domain-containing protein [Pseudotabrizicola algicola]